MSHEKLLGFDLTKETPLSPTQTRTLHAAVGKLRHKTLKGTGWDIQSITVTGKGVETRPKGYTLKKEEHKVDAPTLILQNIFGNEAIVKELVTDGAEKAFSFEQAKQQINSLDSQEKVILLEKIFAILSDSNPRSQDRRDAALVLLRITDLTNVNPEKLKKTYLKAVSNLREGLSQDSDPYGELHMLLEAGKTIAPFIEKIQGISRSWSHVAKAFTGLDRQKILDDMQEIRQLLPRKRGRMQASNNDTVKKLPNLS